jgi:hypothetical protein
MTQKTLIFLECEHEGDLDNYLDDIKKSGGKVLLSRIDNDEVIAEVVVEYEEDEFMEKFINTNAFQFSNLNDY